MSTADTEPQTLILSEEALYSMGYQVLEDPANPGQWLWKDEFSISAGNFPSKDEALADASANVFHVALSPEPDSDQDPGEGDKPVGETAYAGYVVFQGQRIDIDFTVPKGSGKAVIDSAFLEQLAQHMTINYLPIGDC